MIIDALLSQRSVQAANKPKKGPCCLGNPDHRLSRRLDCISCRKVSLLLERLEGTKVGFD